MNQEKLHIQQQLTAWLRRRTTTGGVRRVAPVRAAIASELGCVRTDNQDRAVVARGRDKDGQEYIVVVVADGIGGMRHGAACASLAIGAFVSALDGYNQELGVTSERWIREAAFAADRAVFEQFAGEGGSTLVALVIRPGHRIHWASIGDSRVYVASGKNFTQISVDDTIAGQLGKNAEGSFEQSKLLQFIGMGSELEPHVAELQAANIDAVVLTTDGIHYLSPTPNWLGRIVHNAPDPGACVKRLVELAKWCGGPDNATVAMISLPSDWESDDSLSYSCLEVWDSFGELQLLVASPLPATVPTRNQSNNFTAVNNLHPEKLDPLPTNDPLAGSPSNKKLGKSKTPSRKKNKRSPELHEDEQPQFSMNFPAKTNL